MRIRTMVMAGAAVGMLAAGLSVAPAIAADTVTIHMTVKNCEGCVITAFQAVTGSTAEPFTATAKVSGGMAMLTVPAVKTPGMAFTIQHTPPASALGGDAQPVIAMGFKGVPNGGTVTKAQTLRKGAKASWCWSGSAPGTYDINVKTYYVNAHGSTPVDSGLQMYAWASPTQPLAAKPYWKPAKMMGEQDAPYC